MTVLTRTPENVNLLQPTKYLLTFDRIGFAQYFCQDVNIPGLTMLEAKLNSPLHNYTVAGLNFDYETLDITFTINEDVMSWRNIYNWMLAISSPKSFDQRNQLQAVQNEFKNVPLKSYSDAILTVMTNLNNPSIRVQFYNLFPISLSSIDFSTKQSADNILTAKASFRYEYFEFLD